jgi:hypothetical protein
MTDIARRNGKKVECGFDVPGRQPVWRSWKPIYFSQPRDKDESVKREIHHSSCLGITPEWVDIQICLNQSRQPKPGQPVPYDWASMVRRGCAWRSEFCVSLLL